jgi:hypothetical protein
MMAQATPEPSPIIITTFTVPFMSLDTTFRVDSLLKYYIEKGIKPNPMYKNFRALMHWWGSDNAKVVVIYEIDKFENINKAGDKVEELINASFKTDAEKKLFWKRFGSVFNRHEDTIYSEPVKGK